MFAFAAVILFAIAAFVIFASSTAVSGLGLIAVGLACLAAHLIHQWAPWK
jgi:hypothetical protein